MVSFFVAALDVVRRSLRDGLERPFKSGFDALSGHPVSLFVAAQPVSIGFALVRADAMACGIVFEIASIFDEARAPRFIRASARFSVRFLDAPLQPRSVLRRTRPAVFALLDRRFVSAACFAVSFG